MDVAPRLFESDAKSALGHLEVRCRSCVEKAEEVWNRACEAEPRLRKASRGRGRNAIFNEIVADFAREEFSGVADVDVCEQFGTVRLHVGGEYDLGFKKVDRNGKSSNYPTPRRLRYNNQLPLFGEPVPEAVRLHIGYEWNKVGTEIIDVYLVCPYHRTAVWKYPLAVGSSDALKMPAPTHVSRTKFRSKIVAEGKAHKKAE